MNNRTVVATMMKKNIVIYHKKIVKKGIVANPKKFF